MEEQFEKTAVWVSMVGIIGNAILSTLKLLAGILAHSGAMISDAVHSASDVFSSKSTVHDDEGHTLLFYQGNRQTGRLSACEDSLSLLCTENRSPAYVRNMK